MYAKLFSRITESSLMEEPINVRYTFVLLLAIADPHGYVIGTDVAIARRINMDIKEFKACIEVLSRPDPESNSKTEDGRRVIESDGERGYFLVNYGTYRDMKDEDERRTYMRDYMRKYRGSKAAVNGSKRELNDLTHAEAEADVKAPVSKVVRVKKEKSNPEQWQRLARLFNRRLTTPWTDKEVQAYEKIGTVEEEDLAAIERYYASERAKGDDGVHRRDLGTFLNNFAGELDRAKAATISKNGKSTADTEPEGWREWCASKGYPVGEFRYAKDWIKSEFRRAGK